MTKSVLGLLMDHSEIVDRGRGYYSELFRDFVIELQAQYAELPLELFAKATCIPLTVLMSWLHAGAVEEVSKSVLRFILDHSHSVDSPRGYYSEPFRDFIIELRAQYAELPLELFAEATCVSHELLRRWLP